MALGRKPIMTEIFLTKISLQVLIPYDDHTIMKGQEELNKEIRLLRWGNKQLAERPQW